MYSFRRDPLFKKFMQGLKTSNSLQTCTEYKTCTEKFTTVIVQLSDLAKGSFPM